MARNKKTYFEKKMDEFRKDFLLEIEKLHYTAEEGSLLDRIWKGEKIDWSKEGFKK